MTSITQHVSAKCHDYFTPFPVRKRSKFICFLSCWHEKRPSLAYSVLQNARKSWKLSSITRSEFSIHLVGLSLLGSEVWVFVTPIKVISIMAFCTFQLLFPTEISFRRHSCAVVLWINQLPETVHNKSTQCVYETTFIALPCHNFMSTFNSVVSFDRALKILKWVRTGLEILMLYYNGY